MHFLVIYTVTIPTTCLNLYSLVYIIVNNNELSGTITEHLFGLPLLKLLFLQNNQFTGSLPPSINTNLVTNLDVNNYLTGTIPNIFAKDSRLNTFAASANCFHGSLPVSLCNATSLVSLEWMVYQLVVTVKFHFFVEVLYLKRLC
jgi:hypothetical protein